MQVSSKFHRFFVSLLAVVAILLVTNLGQSAETRRIEIRFEHGKTVGGDVVRMQQNETVQFVWISDQAMSLHLHGYDVEVTLAPNAPHSTELKAFATGRFPLTNHGAGHGHKALMYLEVLPD